MKLPTTVDLLGSSLHPTGVRPMIGLSEAKATDLGPYIGALYMMPYEVIYLWLALVAIGISVPHCRICLWGALLNWTAPRTPSGRLSPLSRPLEL